MFLPMRCISGGGESKRSLEEAAGEKEKAFHSENDSVLIVLGAGKKTNTKDRRKQKLI